ncbi:hypothetical protein [Desnuesiella massiliensis]|nr:hypothetical protein [Desnuesiella massiliensis]
MSRIYIQKFPLKEDFKDCFNLVNNEKVMAMVTERAIPLSEVRGY